MPGAKYVLKRRDDATERGPPGPNKYDTTRPSHALCRWVCTSQTRRPCRHCRAQIVASRTVHENGCE
eukprot:11160077-Lingulodinium_polyedra.AAC.1